MLAELQNFFDESHKVYIVANREKKRIVYYNEEAVHSYGLHEKMYSLEDIFEKSGKTLQEMILIFLLDYGRTGKSKVFSNLVTVKANQEEQVVDLEIGYLSEEKIEIYFELRLEEDHRGEMLETRLNNTKKAMFLANPDEKLTIVYGNDLFYGIFGKDKTGFTLNYRNLFLDTIWDRDKEEMQGDILKTLKKTGNYHSDIQVSTVFGVKKWYYLDIEEQISTAGEVLLQGMMLPIADRVEVAQQLENMNGYFEAIQELTNGALFYINMKTKTATHHSKTLKQAGFPDSMDNFPHCVLPMFHPEDKENFLQYAQEMFQGSRAFHEVRYRTGTDQYSWSRINAEPVYDDKEEIVEIVGKIVNIDEEMALKTRAMVDTLTNALNKEATRETISHIFETSQKGESHAFLFMDLDNFKYVNDNLGHKFGDFLLEELGSRFKEILRADDIIGRVGGDEFVFLLKNVSNFEVLIKKANLLLKTIGTSFNDGNIDHTIYGSVGIALFPLHGKNYEDMYHHADLALYRSKHRGKNMATMYKPEMN